MTSFQRSFPRVVEEVENRSENRTVSRTKSGFIDEELKIGRKIGDGSFGDVYEAYYIYRKVAVKAFRTDSSASLVLLTGSREEDIKNEADIMAKKLNEHTVRLLHHSKSKKVLVIEHCANGSIFDFIRQESNRPIVEDWSSRLKWMYGVALGMLVLHEEPPSVVHRDLKSSNILLDEKLEAKIADFGLAVKTSEISLTHKNCSYPNLAMTYQPPEVRSEGRYSTKSDVYSFGLMMHELLLLKGPYGLSLDAGYVDPKVTNLQKNGEKPKIPEDRTTIPGKWNPCLEDYIKLIEECLHDIPERRPAFREIARRLTLIRRQYEKSKKIPHEFHTIHCAVGVFGSIMVFLVLLVLLIECGRIVCLGKKGGNQIDSKMEPGEYYFFEVLVGIGIIVFATGCCWIIWFKRIIIQSFVLKCAEQFRIGFARFILRVNKLYKRMGSVAPRCEKESAFVVPPCSHRLVEGGTPDIEKGVVPSLVCPESTNRNESPFYKASLQNTLSSASSHGCLKIGEEDIVTIDDNL